MLNVTQAAVLIGHQNAIYTVEAAQKPGIFFTAGNDKGVVEWSSKKKEFIKVIFPVETSVYALHCPKSAPYLISGERSGKISVWNFEEQKLSILTQFHQKPIFDIKSISRKKELIASSEDGTVSIYNLANQNSSPELLYNFRVSDQMVRTISVSADEKQVAFGCKDNRIRIYSADDYSLLHDFEAHSLPVTSLQFSPDGKYLISGSRDAQLNIWETKTYSIQKSIPAHLFAIYSIAFNPSGKYFASASRDKNIKIWSSEDFALKKIISIEKGFQSHMHSINKIAWEPNNGQLISVSDDKLVMIWDVRIDE
ncbi:MAG: WD40 repeat domain-containing protein [Daejeonella sp.]